MPPFVCLPAFFGPAKHNLQIQKGEPWNLDLQTLAFLRPTMLSMLREGLNDGNIID